MFDLTGWWLPPSLAILELQRDAYAHASKTPLPPMHDGVAIKRWISEG
jgi:hypothetical protein